MGKPGIKLSESHKKAIAAGLQRAREREYFCGIPRECSQRETASGTPYRIYKWTCPTCAKACTMLYLDNEWCHGDSMVIVYKDGERRVMCSACWLGA